MERARRHAEGYAKALPKEHGWPPFLMIADVGHCIELFADFSGQGKNYAQFPDRRSFRILLTDLTTEEACERLRLVWSDPHALDSRDLEKARAVVHRFHVSLCKTRVLDPECGKSNYQPWRSPS